ncbi:MAG: nuclear transport factor 2 family protein [Burkholderiales bacterium]|nr:nuclear transport factor 2 family protein [Burkholderiales bacterium]
MSAGPIDLVRSYLAAMERRDLAAASRMLAPGFVMIFPGDKRFETLEALVAWARPRYRSAFKDYERFDVAPAPDGGIVYCYGRLRGELLDGTPYSGIRFIDRFTVAGGKLVDQQVWNDMAEVLGRLGTGG